MSDSDLAEDIVPAEAPQHVEPPPALRTDFKPWHRVRKQFIRDNQWNHEIHHLAQRLRRDLQKTERECGAGNPGAEANQPEPIPETIRIDRPLRCFTLPGDELLDIRCLREKLQAEGCYLRFLGFNNTLRDHKALRKMAVSESAVTQLSRVCRDSHVSNDTFQDISSNNTQAYRLFRQYGPYDVVNLDLCDSLVPRGASNETNRNYTALHQLLNFQIQYQRTPWLLFATTQVDRTTLHQPELNQLAAPTRNNCDKFQSFAKALSGVIPEASFKSQEHALDISYLTPDHLVRVFGVVLGKWLVSILHPASPRCVVKLLSTYRYTIRADIDVEMLSLAFLITPHYGPPVDSTGLSQLRPQERALPAEEQIGIDIVTTAEYIKDVDHLLAQDQNLRAQLAKRKAALLASAGYDPDAYLRWVENGEQETT